jgi:hypothetical protein
MCIRLKAFGSLYFCLKLLIHVAFPTYQLRAKGTHK